MHRIFTMSLVDKLDWSQGCAFMQAGNIYCSPNSKRVVIIPPKDKAALNPFEQVDNRTPSNDSKSSIEMHRFQQPVWWQDSYAWLAFVPLSPSFTATPFEPLCWMPRLNRHRVSEKEYTYRISEQDRRKWDDAETLLVQAAERIRLWYRVPGTPPPVPSSLGYKHGYNSIAIARRHVELSRDCFILWMGFISYLIAQTSRPENWHNHHAGLHPDPNVPVPAWYTKLAKVPRSEHSKEPRFPEYWLDGLNSSTVCTFNPGTPRAGIVYEWAENHRSRPPIEFFLQHHIPIYYPWRVIKENALKTNFGNLNRQNLKPPHTIMRQLMDQLFNSTDLLLAILILDAYYAPGDKGSKPMTMKVLGAEYATSFVFEYIHKKFYSQHLDLTMRYDEYATTMESELRKLVKTHKEEHNRQARDAVAILPTQTMIFKEEEDRTGRLYDDWQSYWAKRVQRRQEMLEKENVSTRSAHLQKEKQKPVKRTTIYTWQVIRSSGGVELFMRVRVNHSEHEKLFAVTSKRQRVYDGFTNEWDVCREFAPPLELAEGPEETCDYDDFSDYEDNYLGSLTTGSPVSSPFNLHDEIHPAVRPDITTVSSPEDPRTVHHSASMDLSDDHSRPEATEFSEIWSNTDNDVITAIKYTYGYVPSLATVASRKPKDWDTVAHTFGFNIPTVYNRVGSTDQDGIERFLEAFTAPVERTIPAELSDLNDESHASLKHLQDFKLIHRPAADLFVFSHPRSQRYEWMLGVENV